MTQMNMPGFGAAMSLHGSFADYLRGGETSDASTQTGAVEPALGFTCFGNVCACAGDDDCNGMFTVACGGRYARCWIRGSGPEPRNVFCICSRSFSTAGVAHF